MRGEYASRSMPAALIAGPPPRARGILRHLSMLGMVSGTTPACAGNTTDCQSRMSFGGGHPRVRGEYWCARLCLTRRLGPPPRARGIRTLHKTARTRLGTTPACAGNTGRSLGLLGSSGDHPRVRGEYFSPSSSHSTWKGPPPRARGIRRVGADDFAGVGTTPACAGNTSSSPCGAARGRDHPRVRGEYTKITQQNGVSRHIPTRQSLGPHGH